MTTFIMPPKSKQTSDTAAWFKSIVVTRKMNKDAHPGQIIHGNSRKRRTKEEMAEYRAELAHAQEEKKCVKEENLRTAAAIEDKLYWRASSTTADVVTQSEPREDEQDNKDPQEKGTWLMLSKIMLTVGIGVYDPEGDNGGDESEVEAEAMSDNELRDKPSKPTIPMATPTSHSVTPTTAETKCKADANHERGLSKKAKKNDPKCGPAGMIKGWQVAEDVKLAASLQAKTNKEEDLMVCMGGFVGDEETDDVEHLALSSLMKTSKKLLPSIIKVTKAKSGPPARMKKDAHGGARKARESNLPDGAAEDFRNKVTPKVQILAGTMPSAWKGLSVPQIQSLVDEVYGAGTHTVKHDSPWWDLVSYRLSDWRSHFVKHARIAVTNHMAVFDYAEEEYTKEDLAKYGSWEVNDEDDMRVKRKGCFQNELILYTLANTHFSEFEDIPDPQDIYDDEMPIGALILALQAVEHAFKFWTTGEFVEDSRLKFNANTYDDLLECKKKPDRSVKEVLTCRSSLYLPSVQSLEKKHWVSIFKAASAILGQSKVGKKKKGHSKSASSAASSEVELEESMPVFTLHSDEDSDEETIINLSCLKSNIIWHKPAPDGHNGIVDGTSASELPAGNAANAMVTAATVTKKALTQHKNLFIKLKVPRLTELIDARGIVLGKVIAFSSKTGGKNGKHSNVTESSNIMTVSNIAVQVFEYCNHECAFHTVTNATVMFQTKQFLLIPSIQFLCLLNAKISDNAMTASCVEMPNADIEWFKALNDGKEQVVAALVLSRKCKTEGLDLDDE
ncbi:hypothetical protein CPB84DRAFT_1851568 [Gymnopilus junonius]|uniref:DUF6532 domain-containing protein n=1 Tax=Gymnopilus junonius TaxID=109634 RepID=A0A9P5NG03_GYMJU|nr:hypothetical protein CPB84DRAFT_1851568 [Gymnopilus junonius]